MMNRVKVSPLKGFQAALLGASILIVGCGSSTTVADRDNNFSGNYSGTVNNLDGSSSPASLNLIQSSSTTGTGDTATTTITIRGILVINPSNVCQVSSDISEGTANSNSIIIELGSTTVTDGTGDDAVTNTSDSGDLALTASGRDLTGSIRFIPDPPTGCPKPGGAVAFRR